MTSYSTSAAKSQLNKAETVYESIGETLTYDVIPIAFATLVMIMALARRTNNTLELMPFIVIQLNTLLVFACQGVSQLYYD